MSWLKDRWEELNAQVKMGDNKTASTVRAARKPAAPAQTMRANTNQPGWSVRKPQPAPLTTQQRISQSYGPTGFTGLKNYAKDMLFDNNSEADRIKRYAATGLNESYDQEQARKTKEAQASNDKLGTIHQVMKSVPAGAGFLAKTPGAIGQMQGRTAKMVNEIDNPLLRTGAKLVSAPLGGLMTTKQADANIKTGRGLNERIDNKMQQSAFGDRADDNKYVTGAGKMFGQLGGQIATGGLGTVAIGSQMAADEANKAEAAGKSNTYSTLTGFGQGGIGALSEKYGVDKFIPGKGNVAGNFVTRMGKRIFTEGAQEAQQQFTQNYIANKAYNPNQSLKEGVLESALMGGLAGGAMSPAVDIMNRPTAPKPTTSLVAPKPEPTRTRLRPEEARIWSDYQETLYKGNRMPAQVVNETHNKARQIADSLGVDIITGSPDEIAGRMNPLLEQSMAFQKEPTTSLVRPKPLNQSGYIQLPGGKDTQLNDTELGVVNYLNNKPIQEGSATQGEGNALPSDKPTPRRQELLDRMKKLTKPMNQGGYIAGPGALGFNDAKAKGLVFDGVDGKPRFEVDDSGASLNNEQFNWGLKMDGKPRKVGDILKHDKMFEQYPELKDVNVRYEPNDLPGHDAHFDPDTNTIVITKSRSDKSHLSDLVHELQHTIQEREGFAGGGAPVYRNYAAENASIKRGLQDVNTTLSGKNLTPEQTRRLRKRRDNLIKQLDETQDQYGNVYTKAKDQAEYRRLAGEAEARAVQSRMNMPMSERYVKPEGETFYHGTTEKWQGDEPKFPLYTTPSKKYAQVFADSTAASSIGKSGIKKADGSMVREFKLNPKARILDATNPKVRAMLDKEYFGRYSVSDKFYPGKNGHLDWTEGENLAEFIAEKKLPYDAVKLDEGGGGLDPQFGVMVDDKGTSVLALNKDAISPNKPRSTFYDSLDVPKQDLIIRNGDGKAMSIDPLESLKAEARKYKSAEEFATSLAKERSGAEVNAGEVVQIRPPQNSNNSSMGGGNLWFGERNTNQFSGSLNGQYEIVRTNPKSVTVRSVDDPNEVYKVNKEAVFTQDISAFTRNNIRSGEDLTNFYNQATQPPTPFEQNLQTAGLAPKKSKGLVVSETKPLNGQKIQKVRTAPGKVEQRVVQDTTLDNLEKQKRQMVDSEARPVRAAELEAAQKQKELRKGIRSSGGIGSSDYESIPTSLKRKGGRAFDDLATEIGFEDGDALYNELNSHTEPRQFNDIREVVESEIKKGNSPLSDQYKELLQQIDDRKAELLRYPDGAKVVRNRQEFPTQDEFNALLSTPESQNPNNKTRAAVSNATSEVKQEQRSAVISGDLTKAQQLREKVGTIETGLEQKAPDLSKNPEFIDLGKKMLKTIKDKKVRKQFETATKEYLGSTRSAEIERQSTIAKLNKQFKLNQDEKLNAILASDSKTVKPMNDKVAKYVAEFHKLTDQAYKGYTEQGVKMGYVSSYLPRIYKNPNTGQLLDTVEYNLLQQSSKRTRGREADIVAKDWLVEKDPTKLLERYYSSMDRMVAGQRYLKQLEQNGLLVKSNSPVSGLRPIIAEGLQPGDGMAYYAPKDVAGKLNHLFGSKETTNLVEKTLEKGAGVNSLFQSFVLSGGVPNTPINAFGMMQLLKEGMALHPVKAGRAFFGGGLSKSYANKVFTAKKDIMKLMAENDLDIRVNLEQTGKWGNRRIRDAFKNEGKAAGLNQAWNEFTNDATFGRFMPMLEVLHFENVYKHQLKGNLIRKPKSSAEAARIAAESTKNFYGKTSVYKTSTRSKAVDDAAGALLFAPRFRESMVNFWVKNAKALVPTNYGKTEYRDNQKFMVASAVMYAAMTMLNEAMNGARMDENPDGKKDKLIIPASVAGKFGIDTKGKDIAVPFLPSIATVPRNLASLGANLATGKFNEAGKNAKAFASMPVKTVGDILTNEDYFGNKIVQDDSSPIQKFTQAASYVASSNMQPWVREALNAKGQNLSKETKKTWGIKEKSTFEALSNAGELPLRFYKPDTYRYGENWTPKGGKDEKFDFKQQRERAALGGEIKNISKTLKLNKRQDELFKSLSSVEFNDDGTLKEDNNPFYKSQRYTALQDDGVFEAMKQKSKLNAKLNGKPIDPIFADNLAPDQRRVLLWKKTLPPGTSDPTVKKLYEQDWYQEYRNKESAYFDGKKAWNKKMGYKDATPNTNEYPTASKDVEDAQNAYFALPKGTGARSSFIRNNPDVWNKMIAFWDSKDAWTNGERSKLGLGAVDDEDSGGFSYGGKGGKGSKGGSKYDYTKNLFASASGDSASTSKQLRAILEKAMSGKS